eukprot:1055789-Pyramimonas_sp.AAC.1
MALQRRSRREHRADVVPGDSALRLGLLHDEPGSVVRPVGVALVNVNPAHSEGPPSELAPAVLLPRVDPRAELRHDIHLQAPRGLHRRGVQW